MNQELLDKYKRLKEFLSALTSAAVAFSGGVDSTLLLYAAKEALGEKAVAVTISSNLFPVREQREAEELCKKLQVRQLIVENPESEMEEFLQNPKNRCYLCKREMFQRVRKTVGELGITEIVEGTNWDDDVDDRPGFRAIQELGILSPLRILRFSKQEIRELSRQFELPTWQKPSYACLASRIPYGEVITEEKLHMIDKAEQLLFSLGFCQLRVRIHGTVARIELLPEEFHKLLKEPTRRIVHEQLKKLGFSYVTLDLMGYRTGSMSEPYI